MTRIDWTSGRVVRDDTSGMSCDIRHEGGRRMALCWGLGGGDNHRPEYRADCDAIARRFVAAWNACEGASVDWLEGFASGVSDALPVDQMIDLLLAQRDELLGLLGELLDIEGQQPGTAAWAAKVIATVTKIQGEVAERRALGADLAYNQAKNDGTLRAQEDARALAIQIKEGGAA